MRLFKRGDFFFPIPFNNPIDQQQYPTKIGEKYRGGHADNQPYEQGQIDVSMNSSADGVRCF